MKIIHFSITGCAGAPIRLVQALQRYTNHEVRLIDLYRNNEYEQDIVFFEQPDLAYALTQEADIIHLHNYLDYHSQHFYPINFDHLHKTGTPIVRQFHSHPSIISAELGIPPSDLLSSPIPSMVVGQFQERFFPDAYVVPNIIPEDHVPYCPRKREDSRNGIFFAPTTLGSGWDERWNTKGAPETLRVLKKVQRITNCSLYSGIGENIPLLNILDLKSQALVVIDELITGSYHLSGLEGLSLGRPTMSYLDERTQYVLRRISGSEQIPFINVRLEEAFNVIMDMMTDEDLNREIGKESRRWIERNYTARKLISSYTEAYESLYSDPRNLPRQPEFVLKTPYDRFLARSLPDYVYTSRKEKNQKISNLAFSYRLQILKKLKKWKDMIR